MKFRPMIVAIVLCSASWARADFINGDFQTGSLTGWNTFTTANGTNGTLGGATLPIVNSFDTTGTGASLAAHFNVGDAIFNSTPQGGGLSQALALTAGSYTITGNFASLDDPDGEINSDAGTLSLIVDGVTQASLNLGSFTGVNQVIRANLSTSISVAAGSHTFQFLITRIYSSLDSATPQEYLDNLHITGAAVVPEPSTITLVAIGIVLPLAYASRRKRVAN